MTRPMSFGAAGAGRRDRLARRRLDLVIAQLLRLEGADDLDLVALLRGKLRPVAVVEGLGQFLALLHHLGEDLQHVVVAGRVLADAAIGDVAVLDRRLDHAAASARAACRRPSVRSSMLRRWSRACQVFPWSARTNSLRRRRSAIRAMRVSKQLFSL